METMVGYLLLAGVLLSMVLLAAGVLWAWLCTGHIGLQYVVASKTAYRFFVGDIHQIYAGPINAQLLINLGIAALLFTPYLRVLVSMLYFAFAQRNLKYTLFTLFVFTVLTYSLWLK